MGQSGRSRPPAPGVDPTPAPLWSVLPRTAAHRRSCTTSSSTAGGKVLSPATWLARLVTCAGANRRSVSAVRCATHGPWRAKLRAGGQHQTESGARYLVDEQTQQFQGGGIDPMQIFHNHQHWLLPRFRREPGQQGLQGLLALPLGRQGQGGIVAGSGRRAGRRARARLWQRQARRARVVSSLWNFSCGVSSSRHCRRRCRCAMTGYRALCW